jgi:hypothetical protein
MNAARIADILRAAGIVPVAPETRTRTGTVETVVLRRVPVVPAVPVTNNRPQREHSRVVLNFRFPTDPPNAWATCIGTAGDSRASIVADLRAKWPGVEIDGEADAPAARPIDPATQPNPRPHHDRIA